MNNDDIPLLIRNAHGKLLDVLNSGSDAELDDQLYHAWARIEKNPDDVSAINELGTIAGRCGKYALAEIIFKYALERDPKNACLYGNLASVYKAREQYTAAIAAYKTALKIDCMQLNYYIAVADCYVSIGAGQQLIDWLGKALKRFPDSVDLLVHMGEALKCKGDDAEALDNFRRARALEPDNTYIHQTLAHTRKFTDRDEDVKAMEALLDDDSLSDESCGRLYFALGKVYEDIADYDRSFEYYEQGNRIVRTGFEYHHEDNARLFSSIKKNFDRKFFQQHQDYGYDTDVPVFILGMPRSGTTLLEQMLACHAQVYGAGELNLLSSVVKSIWSDKGDVYPLGSNLLSSEMLRSAGESYVKKAGELADADVVARITDKMPQNFLYIGVIKLLFSGAYIIHCRRDPLDTCLSCFKNYFSIGHRYSFDLHELGQYYRLYQLLMDHWHEVLPGYILDVDYEALVNDQAGQLKRILEFCDLPWDDACLKFHESDRAAMTASSTQVKKPLYRSGIGYWRHYEPYLQPLIDVLGRKQVNG